VADPTTKREVLFEDASPHFQARIVGDVANQPRVAEMAYQMAGRRFSLASQEGSTTKYKLLARGQGFRFVRQPGRVWSLPAPVKFYGFPDEVRAYYQNAGFLADLEPSPMERHFLCLMKEERFCRSTCLEDHKVNPALAIASSSGCSMCLAMKRVANEYSLFHFTAGVALGKSFRMTWP
jgi:hypothetical protein